MANTHVVQDRVLNEGIRNNPLLIRDIPGDNYIVSGPHDRSKAIFAPNAFTNPFVRGGITTPT